MDYAELVCRSNFSFLRGASHPEELIVTAARLGQRALALTDADGLYGAVKAHLAAKEHGVRLILGAELTLEDGPPVVVYAADAGGYSNLCSLVSQSRMTHPKGEAGLPWRALAERSSGLLALLPEPAPLERVAPLAEAFPERFHVGLCRTLSAGDSAREAQAVALARDLGTPLVVHNDVHTHHRRRQPLQDVLTAVRYGTTVDRVGTRLMPNAERTLKGPQEMARLFADRPDALERTVELASRCRASLDDLRYRFPEEDLPPGRTADEHLRALTHEGLTVRYPSGVPPEVVKQIEHELRLIAALDFAGYFLALWDIVGFARRRGILCQGRGSAANSAVCYALQITAIDPVRMGLLFERFLSMARKEPPDIDVDFEHERREEVLQYVYEKHGRHRAGMVCEVICYRGRLALREAGKAMGLSLDQVDRLSKVSAAHGFEVTPEVLLEAGLSAFDRRVQRTLSLAAELEGFPRHLSIHVGGFVMTREPLTQLVPVENAAMPGRTVIQWEKDDINSIGLLKVDLLALGMLTALSKCFALIREHHGRELSLATIPAEDPKVYDMLCEADTVGVFQIESRAQMNMLPRLKPRTFYDLVVEIALIRPGPIVGKMVHPFLRRRNGEETVVYPSDAVKEILGKTLGVPLFQEQAMKLAMVAAGFSAEEADGLRRVLSHKRAESMLLQYRGRFVEGCLSRGYARAQAEEWFDNFRGFAHYGFPESHSASFALISYASSWLKCHHPAAFTTALLNSQPMGFYAPHTLVADVQRHGVEVRPVDVRVSRWDCTLEDEGRALRLGLRMVRGLGESAGRRVETGRGEHGYTDVGDLARRARIPRHELTRLALAGALASLSGSRRQALWDLQALGPLDSDDLFFGMSMDGTKVELPSMDVYARVCADYDTVGLSLEKHPLELVRPLLKRQGAVTAEGLKTVASGRAVTVGGMMICRQRPPTARGMCFISLEDETGIANLVVPPDVYERCRKALHGALFLVGQGVLERSGKVTNVKVKTVWGLEAAARLEPSSERRRTSA
ncbi:error-prone DNA polymerase [Myxococcus sp. K38C18041901]|uniref:error-prone DNA polymerase n=1 Tax=Myxococcus guangdongensis TaxID=2906760 RepID=UPI0020A76330|nr:error-prone DNA polymerase [Myxococcus guangdongensis]MCP3061503.1 error-prone DNA polymerase [Myxococcus guangdongensis]